MKRTFFSLKKIIPLAFIAAIIGSSCNNSGNNNADKDTASTTTTTDTSHMNMTPAVDSSLPLVAHAEAVLSGTYPDTTVTGKVTFDTANGKVKMKLEITVPLKANKSVAVHIHEHGDCGDTGKMAHGHWNPRNANHGKWGSESFHLGDIGNVKLDGKGKGSSTLVTDLWTLGGSPSSNILGKSIIVHGGVDDFKTQPTGNAGTRIGCGVIR